VYLPARYFAGAGSTIGACKRQAAASKTRAKAALLTVRKNWFSNLPFKYQADREHYLEAFRRAG